MFDFPLFVIFRIHKAIQKKINKIDVRYLALQFSWLKQYGGRRRRIRKRFCKTNNLKWLTTSVTRLQRWKWSLSGRPGSREQQQRDYERHVEKDGPLNSSTVCCRQGTTTRLPIPFNHYHVLSNGVLQWRVLAGFFTVSEADHVTP